ncbi:MAG TPA: toll/interleukin-1 receptor domain-containing protein [Thermoanaerobaculia bacterium]|nr:toll/interleukin-1 receptor domain-containing protein [Thermoanaerobaculia bacterium]
MHDVFISYAREDEREAALLEAALREADFKVFRDRNISGGENWRQRIEDELSKTACVVVVWSQYSISSNFVIEEAERGRQRRILLQVRIHDIRPPFGFGAEQTFNLIEWMVDPTNRIFSDLIRAISDLVKGIRQRESEEGSLLKRAENGDPRAMAELGHLYRSGEGGLPQDEVQAVCWYRRAAEASNGRGMAELGWMYKFGLGSLPQDDIQALAWFQKAAEAGDGVGMYSFGLMLELGSVQRKDRALAVHWYREAAEAGNTKAMNRLGWLCISGGCGVRKDYTQAASWFLKSAEKGDIQGMRYVGVMHSNGWGGLPKSAEGAVRWFRKSANAGSARSKAYLGVMYEKGLGGVPKDEVRALRYYQDAADNGSARGLALLALMYERGSGGLQKDNSQALSLLREAAREDGYAEYLLKFRICRRIWHSTIWRLVVRISRLLLAGAMVGNMAGFMLAAFGHGDFKTLPAVFLVSISPGLSGFGAYVILFRQSGSVNWDSGLMYSLAVVASIIGFLWEPWVVATSGLMGLVLGLSIYYRERQEPIGGEAITIW